MSKTMYETLKPYTKAILELATAKNERGVNRYTYLDIAEMLGFPRNASWAAKVSAICIENGIRRNERTGADILAPTADEDVLELEGRFISFLIDVKQKLQAVLDSLVELDKAVADASSYIVECMKTDNNE